MPHFYYFSCLFYISFVFMYLIVQKEFLDDKVFGKDKERSQLKIMLEGLQKDNVVVKY